MLKRGFGQAITTIADNFDRIVEFGSSLESFKLPAVGLLTAILALVMIVNNYFGFTGLQRFAQFVAVPIIVVWGLYATIKSFTTVSAHQLAAEL